MVHNYGLSLLHIYLFLITFIFNEVENISWNLYYIIKINSRFAKTERKQNWSKMRIQYNFEIVLIYLVCIQADY